MIDYRRKTVIKGQQELRCGYTTGTCAAAAAKAAAVTLLSGEICRDVSLQLPGGEHIILETEFLECSENCVKCGMIKDAGDDPDITNGLLICAAVEKTEGETILIDGGMGVGRVTKPGLDQPVGAAAINSVPRQMIHEAVEDVRRQYAWEKGLKVTVFIPNGRRLPGGVLCCTLPYTFFSIFFSNLLCRFSPGTEAGRRYRCGGHVCQSPAGGRQRRSAAPPPQRKGLRC